MKAIEIIQKVDELEPNQYGVAQKLSWLLELDGRIFSELISAYDSEATMPTGGDDGERTLLIGFPYCEGVYCSFLEAMIAAENFETAKYNQQISMYDSAYSQFRDWYIRSRTHASSGAKFRF